MSPHIQVLEQFKLDFLVLNTFKFFFYTKLLYFFLDVARSCVNRVLKIDVSNVGTFKYNLLLYIVVDYQAISHILEYK